MADIDFVIKVETFINFLSKCRFDKLVVDLHLTIKDGKLFARFSDINRNLYCEVVETGIKIIQEGSINIVNLSKLTNLLERVNSDLCKLIANSDKFIIYDGIKAGCSKLTLTQLGDVEYVESYKNIKDIPNLFDQAKLLYAEKFQYQHGYEIPLDSLLMILKDAKAFGFEIYKFLEKDGMLMCSIEDKSLQESFVRNIITTSKIGTGVIPPTGVIVSTGFREMLTALDKIKMEDKSQKTIKLYFTDSSVLLTDGKTYFYNLHVAMQDK